MNTTQTTETKTKAQHTPECPGVIRGEWEADLHPERPDMYWICRDCGATVEANS
jgi:hypothetical protein